MDGSDPAAALASFSHYLRRQGFSTGPDDTRLALLALGHSHLLDGGEVQDLLRTVYARSPSEWSRFPDLWTAYLTGRRPRAVPPPPRTLPEGSGSKSREEAGPSLTRPAVTGRRLAYSPTWGERFDVRLATGSELLGVRQAAIGTLAALHQHPGTRRGAPGHPLLDMRRTMAAALRLGGEPAVWHERRRRPQPPAMVLVVDCSGSMREHASYLLTWAWALSRLPIRLEVFVFSTEVIRLTPRLRRLSPGQDPLVGLDALSGGTKIGAALEHILTAYRERLGPRTTLAVASDGFDSGDQALLSVSTRALAARVHCLTWLNPAASQKGYRPQSAGIRTVLPLVDQHLPVHDRASMLAALQQGAFRRTFKRSAADG
jgi:hypothetical protein